MKKIIAFVIFIIAITAIIFTLNSDKKQMIGTWYYETKPEKNMTIYKNNTAVIKDTLTEGGETYNYTFEDKVLTLYSYGVFMEKTYYVDIKGNKMYLSYEDDTIVLYDSYEAACDVYEKAVEERVEQIEKERQEEEEQQREYENQLKQYMPTEKDAELYLEKKGYYDYEYCVKDEYLHNLELYGDMYYPTVVYYYDIYIDGEKHEAYIAYYYDNFEWVLYKDIVFERYFLGYD